MKGSLIAIAALATASFGTYSGSQQRTVVEEQQEGNKTTYIACLASSYDISMQIGFSGKPHCEPSPGHPMVTISHYTSKHGTRNVQLRIDESSDTSSVPKVLVVASRHHKDPAAVSLESAIGKQLTHTYRALAQAYGAANRTSEWKNAHVEYLPPETMDKLLQTYKNVANK